MKKLISLLLLAAMVLSLCACGEVEVTQEQVEDLAEAVEEAMPAIEELVQQAAELYHSGDYSQLQDALEGLEAEGTELVTELMGLCHYYGYGTEIDTEKAVEMLEALAEKGSAAAKHILAEASFSGDGAVQDPEKAQQLYAEFIELAESLGADEELAGSVYAALSDCYARGMGTELDLDKARAAAEKAIASGSLSEFDKAELADFLSGIAKDAKAAVEAELDEMGLNLGDLELKLAELKEIVENSGPYTDVTGHQDTIKKLEEVLDKLEQADAELSQSSQLYSEAKAGIMALAESGNVIALKLMGDYYYGALGGEAQDYEKALEYYMQAAELDYAPAQAQIALMYQEGHGVEVNYEMAMEWNNRAAQQGNAQGQAQIGYLYHMGLGVTQNLDEAGRWYSRAADQGDTWAAAKLAQTEITNPQLAFEFHA